MKGSKPGDKLKTISQASIPEGLDRSLAEERGLRLRRWWSLGNGVSRSVEIRRRAVGGSSPTCAVRLFVYIFFCLRLCIRGGITGFLRYYIMRPPRSRPPGSPEGGYLEGGFYLLEYADIPYEHSDPKRSPLRFRSLQFEDPL